MAYDEGLAQRIREILADRPGLVEKKMFGGLGYMFHGNMACGVNKDDLIVRVAADSNEELLTRAHTRQFDLTGRPMKGWILVAAGGYESDADLHEWVNLGVEYALSLPAK